MPTHLKVVPSGRPVFCCTVSSIFSQGVCVIRTLVGFLFFFIFLSFSLSSVCVLVGWSEFTAWTFAPRPASWPLVCTRGTEVKERRRSFFFVRASIVHGVGGGQQLGVCLSHLLWPFDLISQSNGVPQSVRFNRAPAPRPSAAFLLLFFFFTLFSCSFFLLTATVGAPSQWS